MGFLDNLKKNNFKSISERAISNLQNKNNQNTEKKVEKVSTTETSGITKQSDLSKAGLANTAMGTNESNTYKKNYFNDTFINPNKTTLGENMFNNVENKNVKEILESIILQENLLGFVKRNKGKVGLGAGLAAGAAAHTSYTKPEPEPQKPEPQKPEPVDHSDKLKHDAIMKQGTDQQTIASALDPARAKAFDAMVNNTFNEI